MYCPLVGKLCPGLPSKVGVFLQRLLVQRRGQLSELGINMQWIVPGTFMMGSTPEERAWAAGSEGKGEASWYTDEGDRPRQTRIREGFWLGETEITRGQWKQFITRRKPSEAARHGFWRTRLGAW